MGLSQSGFGFIQLLVFKATILAKIVTIYIVMAYINKSLIYLQLLK